MPFFSRKSYNLVPLNQGMKILLFLEEPRRNVEFFLFSRIFHEKTSDQDDGQLDTLLELIRGYRVRKQAQAEKSN